MLFRIKKHYQLTKAFQRLFLDENKQIKEEAKIVLAFLRDECGALGELGRTNPYYYDDHGRFDNGSAGFLLGKRRIFDLMQKYINLDEKQVFALLAQEDEQQALIDKLNI